MSYATFLTFVVVLLAFGFLVFGFMVLSKRQGWFSASRLGQADNVLKLSPLLVLLLPAFVLLVGISPTLFPPITPIPTPTIVHKSSPTPISLPAGTLLANGTLTIGVSDKNSISPPEIYYNNGSAAGFDIDLIKAIAQAMNLKAKITPTQVITQATSNVDQLLDGLKKKKFDVVISAYTVTERINAEFLSVPYLSPKDVLLVPNGNPTKLNFDQGLTNLCGHTIGVQDGSLELDALKGTTCPQDQPITPVKLTKVDDVANALINKQQNVEAIYQSTPTASYYQTTHPNIFQQIGTKVPIAKEGILIQQDKKVLQAAMQTAFALLVQNGKYQQLLKTPVGDMTGDAISAS